MATYVFATYVFQYVKNICCSAMAETRKRQIATKMTIHLTIRLIIQAVQEHKFTANWLIFRSYFFPNWCVGQFFGRFLHAHRHLFLIPA